MNCGTVQDGVLIHRITDGYCGMEVELQILQAFCHKVFELHRLKPLSVDICSERGFTSRIWRQSPPGIVDLSHQTGKGFCFCARLSLEILCTSANIPTPMLLETVKKMFLHLEFMLTTQGSIATHGIGSTRPNKSIDAGVLSSDLAGVMMPAPDSTPECVGIPGLSLHYDEFIVYDVSQVKIRYLFRVKL